ERRGEGRVPAVPRNVGLPWLLNSRTDLNVSAGPYAAFLGPGYDPVWADFDGDGKKVAPKYGEGQKKEFLARSAECGLDGGFGLSSAGEPADGVPPARLGGRR